MAYNGNPKNKPFTHKGLYTDGDGNLVDRRGNKVDVKEHDVPMYRAYGKRKVYRPWLEKLNDLLAIGLFFMAIVFPMAMAVGAIVLASLKYAEVYSFATLLVGFFIFAGLLFFYIFALRIPRKRLRFYGKLKKACKKNGYNVNFVRNFWSSLFWTNDDSVDIMVKAGGYTYLVKLFGAQNRKSDITFWHNGDMIYRKLRLRNNFTLIFDLKPKAKQKKICFKKSMAGEKVINAVVLNPAPTEIYKRNANGDTEMSGNNDKLFGYTVYTGFGFIEALRRNAENDITKRNDIKY